VTAVRDAGHVAPTLAIHPGALGDVLLAVPALRALRASRQGVVLAAQPRIGALLEALGVVDRHVAFDSLGLDALFVDDAGRAPRLPRLARVVCWFGARDPEFVRRLTVLAPGAVVAAPAGDGRLVWEYLLQSVGAGPGEWRSPVTVPDSVRALGTEALAAAGADGPPPWLVVHPGAGSAAKRWPAEAFARAIVTLAAHRRLNVLVHQGPADAEAAAALRRHIGAGAVWLVDPTLAALAGVLAHAHAYLGNDSGVSHLAAALGVPALVLFDTRHLAWQPWWVGARPRTVTLTVAVPDEVAAVIAELTEMLG
jgi:heptosyltransferase III